MHRQQLKALLSMVVVVQIPLLQSEALMLVHIVEHHTGSLKGVERLRRAMAVAMDWHVAMEIGKWQGRYCEGAEREVEVDWDIVDVQVEDSLVEDETQRKRRWQGDKMMTEGHCGLC